MLKRQSNIELLRIVSMLMILALHVNFFALGTPSTWEINVSPFGAIGRTFMEFLCIVAVNVFVLISGWFGINAKIKSFLKFLFQILFFYVGIYVVFLVFGWRDLSWDGIKECFFLKGSGWFIKAYIGLYILSPILNAFVKQSSERQLRLFLIAFYVFQTIYGWYFVDSTKFFAQGYSTLSFIGLYMLARYIKKYALEKKYFALKKECDVLIFLGIVVLETILFVVARTNNLIDLFKVLWIYSSPLVILSALHLLLYFSKLNFSSNFVNVVAASSFSVYLFHSDPNIMAYYLKYARGIYNTYSSFSCFFMMVLVVLVFYVVATILDRLRIWSWDIFWKKCGNGIETWFSKL